MNAIFALASCALLFVGLVALGHEPSGSSILAASLFAGLASVGIALDKIAKK
jgi:hypothetical protein